VLKHGLSPEAGQQEWLTRSMQRAAIDERQGMHLTVGAVMRRIAKNKRLERQKNMSRMPCRVSDDPFYDYSDYIEGQGVYAAETEAPCEPEDDPEYLDEK